MKKIFVVIINLYVSGIMLSISSCNTGSEKKILAEAESGSTTGVTSGSFEIKKMLSVKLPHQSDEQLDKALKEFEKKDYESCSERITAGIKDIEEELQESNHKASQELQLSLNNLSQDAKKVKSGKMKSVEILKNDFAETETELAQNYLMLSKDNSQDLGKLEKQLEYLSSALKRGERVAEEDYKKSFQNSLKESEDLREKVHYMKKYDKSIQLDIEKIEKGLASLSTNLKKPIAKGNKM